MPNSVRTAKALNSEENYQMFSKHLSVLICLTDSALTSVLMCLNKEDLHPKSNRFRH